MYSFCFGRPIRPVERRSQHRPLCLVVDDDAVGRAVAQSQLRMLGLDAIGAASGHEALVLIARRSPSMVLLDHGLPDTDGYSLARRIRRQERGGWRRPRRQPLVLVALSAQTGRAHLRRCLAVGIDCVLSKPVSLPALAAALGLRFQMVARQPVGAAGAGGAATVAAPVSIGELYRSTCLRDLATLKSALLAGDHAVMRTCAHRIRGASQVVGAHAIAGIAAVLERADGARVAGRSTQAQAQALLWLEHLLSSPGDAGVPP